MVGFCLVAGGGAEYGDGGDAESVAKVVLVIGQDFEGLVSSHVCISLEWLRTVANADRYYCTDNACIQQGCSCRQGLFKIGRQMRLRRTYYILQFIDIRESAGCQLGGSQGRAGTVFIQSCPAFASVCS